MKSKLIKYLAMAGRKKMSLHFLFDFMIMREGAEGEGEGEGAEGGGGAAKLRTDMR